MVQYFPVVTGSLTVTGSINVSGGITASGGISISGSIASASFASTASFVALAQSASNAVAAATASFANAFTVAGNLTAQTLVVQTITSSVDFVTGSTRFGSILANTHVFSGSVTMNPGGLFVSGSGLVGIGTTSPSLALNVIGQVRAGYATNAGVTIGLTPGGIPNNDLSAYILWGDNATFGGENGDLIYVPRTSTTGAHRFYTGAFGVASEKVRITSGGNVGIGTASPTSLLDITSTGTVIHTIKSSSTGGTREATLRLSVANTGTNDSAGKILFTYGSNFTEAAKIETISSNTGNWGDIVFSTTSASAERMRITSGGEIVRGPIREFATALSPPDPYTGDARLNITHTPWGGNNDSGTVYVEFQARAYGNNQTTCAYGIITYRLGDNGINVTNVSTAGVTTSNVTISTDVSTNYILRITFGVTQNTDRISVFARTTNGVVSSISANIV